MTTRALVFLAVVLVLIVLMPASMADLVVSLAKGIGSFFAELASK